MSAMQKSFICALALLVVLAVYNAEGRYLPTRSDNSRYEHIKEVLRALLDLNEPEGHSARQGYPYDEALRSKRETSNQHLPSSIKA